jgi:hypothetical protein
LGASHCRYFNTETYRYFTMKTWYLTIWQWTNCMILYLTMKPFYLTICNHAKIGYLISNNRNGMKWVAQGPISSITKLVQLCGDLYGLSHWTTQWIIMGSNYINFINQPPFHGASPCTRNLATLRSSAPLETPSWYEIFQQGLMIGGQS